ncbi:MAG: carboxypeptidase-like regulatory domain-containing protein [Chloroflexota bacterium]
MKQKWQTQMQLKGFWAVGCAIVLALAVSFYSQPSSANAHGTAVTYSLVSTVRVNAEFDTGEPMSEAQVTVYAPNDPQTPWLKGVADADGNFSFDPDPEIIGDYSVQVRLAGHGEFITVPVGGGTASSTGGQTTAQQLIMAAAVIWGFIGTALYFSARKKDNTEAEKEQNYAHT